MHELITLAKENSFLAIGLLVVTLYLQDRIDFETTALRLELRQEIRQVSTDLGGEIAANRQAIAANQQAIVNNQHEIIANRQEIAINQQAIAVNRQELAILREDLSAFKIETTDRLARIESLLEHRFSGIEMMLQEIMTDETE